MKQFTMRVRPTRGFFAICLNYLITNTGYYILLPLLTILLTREKNVSLADTALLLFILTTTIRGGQFFIGPFLDRLNIKTTLALGVFITGISFIGMGYVTAPILLILCAAIAGLGASINVLAGKVYVANLGEKDGKSFLYFSTTNVVVNVASSLGSLIGSYLLIINRMAYTFQLAGACYLIAGVSVLLLLRPVQRVREQEPAIKFWSKYKEALSDTAYLKSLVFIFLGWFCYTQLYSTLPYFVSTYYHMADKLGILFTLNALLIIILQLFLSASAKRLLPRGKEHYLFFFAYLLYSAAFFSAGLYLTFGGIVLSVVLLTLAEMLFTPSADTIVSKYAKASARSTYFSVSGVVRAMGEGAGSYLGLRWLGFWFQWHEASNFWLSLTLLVGIACLSFWVIEYRSKRRKPESNFTIPPSAVSKSTFEED